MSSAEEKLREMTKEDPLMAVEAWLSLGVELCKVLPKEHILVKGIVDDALKSYKRIKMLARAMGGKR